ncbi:uncharacterized protein LOC135317799 isoform X4 [Phalacrocorax carbo]|uniref:uncharacterized protein LOC135317799 isoform X4 n=1 Tax=Phalacrocorax carbo TaxID=9209 RepID=UPI00311A3147
MVSWLQEFNQGTEVLRQQIKTLEEALEEEEMWTLILLLVSLQLAVGFPLAAVVLYASWYDPELFHRLLLHVLCETNIDQAIALGKIFPRVMDGPLPF